jgi:hypothetical protein
MILTPETRVFDLLSQYPFIKEYLIQLHPHFIKLNNPVMMQTLGRIATLHRASQAVEIPVDTFISGIENEIKKQTGQAAKQES